MNNQELNSYIYGYLTNDLTRGVLMLTGASGIGKSHYIRNELIPYLKQTPESFHCLVVSLYGVKDLIDVSRSVFLENRARALNTRSEKAAVGAIMAKTILKNFARQTNMELSTDKEDIENLFTSVDLTDRLVIFEDIEDAKLSEAELCGYFSGLAFQDGVKMLLVMNDAAESEDKDSLRLALKKISTEIVEYEPDYESFIVGSIAKYHHPLLKSLIGETERAEIEQCFDEHGFKNRGFFYACRRTVDLFRKMEAENADANYDPDFLKAVFMGILHYSMRLKSNKNTKWEDEYQLSFRLGSDRYPLFRFCYNFLTRQLYEPAQVLRAQELYQEFREYDRNPPSEDPDLELLYTWRCQKESDLREAMDSITRRLRNPVDFDLREYGKIARSMLTVGSILDYDLSAAEDLMIANLKGQGLSLNTDYIVRALVPQAEDSEAEAAAVTDLRKRMMVSLKIIDTGLLGFRYLPSEIDIFDRLVQDKIDRILIYGSFARAMDNQKIQAMLKQCDAKQIYDFHHAYIAVYSLPECKDDGLSGDAESLVELSGLLKELETYEGYDRIQKKNIQDFANDLDAMRSKLLN